MRGSTKNWENKTKSKANVSILVDFLPVLFLFLDLIVFPSRHFFFLYTVYFSYDNDVTILGLNIIMYDLTIKF